MSYQNEISGGGSGRQNSDESASDYQKKKAAEEYKHASTLKAGAVMHGPASKAQEQMDKAMADMIRGKNK